MSIGRMWVIVLLCLIIIMCALPSDFENRVRADAEKAFVTCVETSDYEKEYAKKFCREWADTAADGIIERHKKGEL